MTKKTRGCGKKKRRGGSMENRTIGERALDERRSRLKDETVRLVQERMKKDKEKNMIMTPEDRMRGRGKKRRGVPKRKRSSQKKR